MHYGSHYFDDGDDDDDNDDDDDDDDDNWKHLRLFPADATLPGSFP